MSERERERERDLFWDYDDIMLMIIVTMMILSGITKTHYVNLENSELGLVLWFV